MARTPITAASIPNTAENITDATFTTMATGSGNGVSFPYNNRGIVILRNDTGGNATYTLKVTVPADLTAIGVTPADQTVVLATGKIAMLKPGAVLQGVDASKSILIDCDVAAQILVRNVPSD